MQEQTIIALFYITPGKNEPEKIYKYSYIASHTNLVLIADSQCQALVS